MTFEQKLIGNEVSHVHWGEGASAKALGQECAWQLKAQHGVECDYSI